MFRLICVSNIRHFDKWLLVSSDMEYIIQVENRWTGLFLAYNDKTEYSVKKIGRKSWKTARNSYKFVQTIPNFFQYLKIFQNFLNISETSKYL